MSHPPGPPSSAPSGDPASPTCRHLITYRRETNHPVHAALTLVTCFMWLPVWVCVVAWNAWGPPAAGYAEHHGPCPWGE